jgi:D-alanyl-D-alanine carboxypeptidase/D-alanyl-D-alanine-endopeptidase (penicillin-binding protein 4)
VPRIYGVSDRISRGPGIRPRSRTAYALLLCLSTLAQPGLAFLPADAEIADQSSAQVPAAAVAELPAEVLTALRSSGIPPSALSVLITDADGRIRLAYLGDAIREVGSLIKLVTTLAALDRLGPAFQFHTDLLAEPAADSPGLWQLALRGGGDPGLRYQDLLHLLRAAQAAGMGRPRSQVAVDLRRFAEGSGAATGIRLDPDRVSGIRPSALQIDWSTMEANLPAGGRSQVLLEPPFPLQVLTTPVNGNYCPDDWTDQLYFEPTPGSLATPPGLVLRGRWPESCPAAILRRAPLAALDHLSMALTTAWRSLGHAEILHAVPGPVPSYATVAIRQPSRALAELVRDTNKYSNNVMARTLLLDLAAEDGRLPATVADGAEVVQHWLAAAGMAFPELDWENGSGLSHRERLTASHLSALLKYALTLPVASEFISSLAIPGAEGSLQGRFRGLRGAERLRLKSGGLEGVRGLAGYMSDGHGGYATVVCIINDPRAEAGAAVQAALLTWALNDKHATPEPE